MIWFIEPYDPLLVRDGRPFGPNPGARARSLSFPFPSTSTGAARTRAGENGNGHFDPGLADAVKEVSVRGPLLVELQAGSEAAQILAPAPHDAVPFDESGGRLTYRMLAPLASIDGASSDLDDILQHLVGLAAPDFRKPSKDAPAFWYWDRFSQWLQEPDTFVVNPKELGLEGLPTDRRFHSAMDPETLTGLDGALFMTSGLTFWQNDEENEPSLSHTTRLALAIDVDGTDSLAIDPGYGPMGGERRLMHWQLADIDFPKAGAELKKKVVAAGHCRIVLLTPAFFEDGWQPGWLTQSRDGVVVELLAAAVGKPQTVSGWDLVARAPRPSRRLAPAGSVFYLKLDGTKEDIERWFDNTWFQCVSDTFEDRNAGFGLAAIGYYSGTPETIILEEDNDAQSTA